jgi:hypothetical protein
MSDVLDRLEKKNHDKEKFDIIKATIRATIEALHDEGFMRRDILVGYQEIGRYMRINWRHVKGYINFGLPVAVIGGKHFTTTDAIDLWLQANIEHQVNSRMAELKPKLAEEYKKRMEIQKARQGCFAGDRPKTPAPSKPQKS